MKYFVIFLVLIGILGFATNVFALESYNPTPLELWESNELVIDGTVIEVDTERIFSEELIRSYQIKVHEYFKGPHKFDLVYAQEPFSNKYFKTGERILFYLYKDNSNSYQVHSASLKTFENCNARDLIEISPVLPNEKPPISTPVLDENFIDSCIPDYYDVDPDFGGVTIYPAPLKQVNAGIEPQNVQCQDPNKTLVLKMDGSPACMKPESVPKLIDRGWANGIKIENEWTTSHYPNKRPLPNGTFDTNLENVVPWLMMQELEQRGVKNWKNDPSIGVHTDEGWSNPSKMCFSLFVDVKTKLYISSTFYSEPKLFISEIIIDDSKPTDCQKWFTVPYGVDSKTGYLLYDYVEK